MSYQHYPPPPPQGSPYGQPGYYPPPQPQPPYSQTPQPPYSQTPQPPYYPNPGPPQNPHQYYPPPPGPPPQLPHGWICRYDENQRQAYYVNTGTGASQWIFPGETGAARSAGYAAHEPQRTVAPQYSQGSYDPKAAHEKEKKDKLKAGAVGGVAGFAAGAFLTHEWDEHKEKERRRHEYGRGEYIVEERPEYVVEENVYVEEDYGSDSS